jgi:hypothetical protein
MVIHMQKKNNLLFSCKNLKKSNKSRAQMTLTANTKCGHLSIMHAPKTRFYLYQIN